MHGLGVRPSRYAREERLDDAGAELALEVHDVERDPEPAGDAPRVLGRVQRAAALLELRDGVRDVVQAHPDADDLVALLGEQRRRDRAVDAAGHGDEDPAHRGDRLPQRLGGEHRGDARASRRGRAARSATASSISASVVVRPSDRRSAPRASSVRVAHRRQHVADGSVEPRRARRSDRRRRSPSRSSATIDRRRRRRRATTTDSDVRQPLARVAGELDALHGEARAAGSRSRSARTRSTVAVALGHGELERTPIPTAPATSSVPARRYRSCVPPCCWARMWVPRADPQRADALRALDLVRARARPGRRRAPRRRSASHGGGRDGVDVEQDAAAAPGRRAAISAIGWSVPTSLFASITATRIVRSLIAASTSSGSTRP